MQGLSELQAIETDAFKVAVARAIRKKPENRTDAEKKLIQVAHILANV